MSLKPGIGVHGEIDPAIGSGSPTTVSVASVTQNPMTPVEYGRTAESSKYTTTDSADPLPDYGTPGGLAVTITGLVVNGNLNVADGGTDNYTATVNGTNVNTANGTFNWSVTGGVASTVGTPNASATSVTFNGAGSYTVSCTYTEAGATGSPATGNVTVVVA